MDEAQTIIELERGALDRWGKGDPSGALELTADDISYIDPIQPRPLHGLKALTDLYESLRGRIKIDRSEIANPRVQFAGETAVLTFQFFSEGTEGSMKWNATEVYHKADGQWRIIHTHWSYVQPVLSRQ